VISSLAVFDRDGALEGLGYLKCLSIELRDAGLLMKVRRLRRFIENDAWADAHAVYDDLRSEVVLTMARLQARAKLEDCAGNADKLDRSAA
jgi:hypothetical protein